MCASGWCFEPICDFRNRYRAAIAFVSKMEKFRKIFVVVDGLHKDNPHCAMFLFAQVRQTKKLNPASNLQRGGNANIQFAFGVFTEVNHLFTCIPHNPTLAFFSIRKEKKRGANVFVFYT